jgi:spore germination protein GerM
VQQLLIELARGPDDAEHAHGLSTALPSDATLTLAALDQGEAVVAINGGTKDADPRRLPLSVAQVVLTLTSHPDVRAVRITSDGQPVEAPLADGIVVNRPLTAADYRSFLAGRGTPSPTRSP